MMVVVTAGEVLVLMLVLELSNMPSEQVVSTASVDLLQDHEGFT